MKMYPRILCLKKRTMIIQITELGLRCVTYLSFTSLKFVGFGLAGLTGSSFLEANILKGLDFASF